MSEAPKEIEKNPAENLSGTQKMEVLLGLFGTEDAREKFKGICKEYFVARLEQIAPVSDSENYRKARKVVYSPPRRAELHNTIMDTISRLATQTKNLTPIQEAVLRDFHSRENVAQAINNYVLAIEERVDDDEDEELKKKGGMSETAYYHSLGKEH